MNIINRKNNVIISSLDAVDCDTIRPHLEYKEFKPGPLSKQRGPEDCYIYFVLSGIFALTIQVDGQDTAFVLLGHDSIIDATVTLDNGLDTVQALCLTNLTAYALLASTADALLPRLPSLNSSLMTANRNLFMKMARVTACSQNHTSHQRLAAWLLRASDLTESPRLAISHHVLAQLHGIRRAGATIELGKLKASNAITTGYGWIEIKDRAVLEQHACSCYHASTVVLQPRLGQA